MYLNDFNHVKLIVGSEHSRLINDFSYFILGRWCYHCTWISASTCFKGVFFNINIQQFVHHYNFWYRQPFFFQIYRQLVFQFFISTSSSVDYPINFNTVNNHIWHFVCAMSLNCMSGIWYNQWFNSRTRLIINNVHFEFWIRNKMNKTTNIMMKCAAQHAISHKHDKLPIVQCDLQPSYIKFLIVWQIIKLNGFCANKSATDVMDPLSSADTTDIGGLSPSSDFHCISTSVLQPVCPPPPIGLSVG